MLWLGSWIVFFGFWFYAVRLGMLDSRWLAFGFVILWICARIGLTQLGSVGSIYFVSFAAMLTAIMCFIDLYRSRMGLRNPQKEPD